MVSNFRCPNFRRYTVISIAGTYVAVFSSNPEQYAWVLVCLDYEDNMRRCPDNRMILNLYTRE